MNSRLVAKQFMIVSRASSLLNRVVVSSAPKLLFSTAASKPEATANKNATAPETTSTTPPPIHTKIQVKDYCFSAVIGINPEEREKKQFVFMDLSYTYDASKCIYVKEDMANGIHYGDVSRYAKMFIMEKQFKLLENCVFETIIAIIRKFPQIRHVELTVKKLSAIPEAESTECYLNSSNNLEAIAARLRHDRETNVPIFTPSAEVVRAAKVEEQTIARDKAFNERQMAEMMANETMAAQKKLKKKKTKKE